MALIHRDRAPHWQGDTLPDQTGRRFVVTGAGGGLGLACSHRLAHAGAEVIMAVRSPERAEVEAQRIRATNPRGTVTVARVDVSSMADVRRFADSLDRVDVLINNAGVMALPETRSVDGHEMQLATNYLGPFALTNLLLPKMTDRNVIISSVTERTADLHVDDLNFDRRPYHRVSAYAQSKLALMLFLAELQRRLTEVGSELRSVGAHPGYTSTGIVSHTGSRAFTKISGLGNALFGMDPSRGVLPLLYVSLLDIPGNSYFGPHGPGELRGYPVVVRRSRRASDPGLARALWDQTEELTGVRFGLSAP